MAVKPIPDNYPRVTPYLCIKGAAEAIDFYKKAFGATERMRMGAPGGTIGHAEIDIDGATAMQRCAIRTDTCGRSPRTSKISRRKR